MIKGFVSKVFLPRKELCVFSAIEQTYIKMLSINSNYRKPSDPIYYDKMLLRCHADRKSLHAMICSINKALDDNNSYKLSLRFNESMDYIDLSSIKDNVESMEITYNSNCNMNKTVMIYCIDKKKLKEITFNFNTQENIYIV